jgi:hypothetical protein
MLKSWHIWLPCAVLILYAHSLVFYQIPNNLDLLDESGEPLKTLKFVHSRGQAVEKWGPMPSFLYAPVYAVPMAYWYLTGGLGKPITDYPYGFARPHEQEGFLIVLARLLVLAVAAASTVFYGRALYRFTGSRQTVFVVLTLFIATSAMLGFKYVSSRPDGFMLAFVAASMAVYADIVSNGLTWQRGALLSLLAVFSISCKELTAPVYVLPYAGIGVAEWIKTQGDLAARRRFLMDMAITIVVGLVAYALLNIVYAPATWIERMKIWLLGSGKDPNVWAPSWYTPADYLVDAWWSLVLNIGPGGIAALAAAAAISLIAPLKHRLLIWLPSIGFLGIVLLTAGYMPDYFLSPLALTLPLPVAASLAYGAQRWGATAPPGLRASVLFVTVGCMIANAWQGNLAWGRVAVLEPTLVEEYCKQHVGKNELIQTGNLFVRQPGFDRLSYLGFNMDDQALGALMTRPERMPDVILISGTQVSWMEDLKKRPARNRMLTVTGYSYDQFPDLESLGYRLVEKVHPTRNWLTAVPWVPLNRVPNYAELYVYRKRR